jgi:hypothetical protein
MTNSMLDGWREFYILLRTAAAALVALLFVAASIGAGYLSAARGSPTHTYTSPIIFHYTYVLFLSLVALIPINTDWSFSAIIGISAAIALVYSFFIFVRVMRGTASDLDDRLGYGASPLAAYAGTLAASIFIFQRSNVGPPLLAGALILLLLINIRNAWDLTLFLPSGAETKIRHRSVGGLDQCRRNSPSTARISAGLIRRACATVTECSGPSSFSSQKLRNLFSWGNAGQRS